MGSGAPVLLLHGGPGLSFTYMDELAPELEDGFRVASFQQRGLEPSTLEGPFTIPQAIDDVVAVLDGLEWERAFVLGHSWGGHLTLRVAAELAKGKVRYGIVAGGASPIPWGQAARASVELSSQAFLEVVPNAGHFIWLDAPGRVRAAMRRLTDQATP